jgi:hypothetical protein
LLDALVNLDTQLARRVLIQDDDVDAMNRRMFRVLQDMMARKPETVERAVHTLSVSAIWNGSPIAPPTSPRTWCSSFTELVPPDQSGLEGRRPYAGTRAQNTCSGEPAPRGFAVPGVGM